MRTAPDTAVPSGSELVTHTASTLGAREQLEESEQLCTAELDGADRFDGSPEHRRRRLVHEALAAYVQLAEPGSAGPAADFALAGTYDGSPWPRSLR